MADSVTSIQHAEQLPGEPLRLAIEVDKIFKTYTRRRWLGLRPGDNSSVTALRNVSLAVREGEMVGLLGPNGAGKTTLLKSVATLLEVNSGRILVYGCDVQANPIPVRRMVGLVTCDERSFYWRLSGRHNLRFFAALYGVPTKLANQRISPLLDRLGLQDAADRPYHTYSTGMRQKLAIARGLLAEPRLVLYDEPTRSLDPLSAQSIRSWIRASRLASPSVTHLIATNQLHEAEQLCDRVVILNRGAVIADDAIGRIREKFQAGGLVVHRITCSRFAASGNLVPEPKAGLFEVTEADSNEDTITLRLSTSEIGEGLSFALAEILRRGGKVLRCETTQVPFDEVFCALVAGDGAADCEGAR